MDNWQLSRKWLASAEEGPKGGAEAIEGGAIIKPIISWREVFSDKGFKAGESLQFP